jgi:hypothetical protein
MISLEYVVLCKPFNILQYVFYWIF